MLAAPRAREWTHSSLQYILGQSFLTAGGPQTGTVPIRHGFQHYDFVIEGEPGDSDICTKGSATCH